MKTLYSKIKVINKTPEISTGCNAKSTFRNKTVSMFGEKVSTNMKLMKYNQLSKTLTITRFLVIRTLYLWGHLMAIYCDNDKPRIIKYEELMVTVEIDCPTSYR